MKKVAMVTFFFIFLCSLSGCVTTPEVSNIPVVSETGHDCKVTVTKYHDSRLTGQWNLFLHPRDIVIKVSCDIEANGFHKECVEWDFWSDKSVLAIETDLEDIFTVFDESRPLEAVITVAYLQYNQRVTKTEKTAEVYRLAEVKRVIVVSTKFAGQVKRSKVMKYSGNLFRLDRVTFQRLYREVSSMRKNHGEFERLKKMAARISNFREIGDPGPPLENYLLTFKYLVEQGR